MISINSLRSKANAATQGKWESKPYQDNCPEGSGEWAIQIKPTAFSCGFGAGAEEDADATFIAANSPEAILNLLDALEIAIKALNSCENKLVYENGNMCSDGQPEEVRNDIKLLKTKIDLKEIL